MPLDNRIDLLQARYPARDWKACRICHASGGAMSQVENTLALSQLLRRFRPEYAGDGPAGINATVTLTPKGGLNFRVKELS